MERHRQLLWSHGWVMGRHGQRVSQAEIESFIRYGVASTGIEPRFPGVDDKVAEIWKLGEVRFN